MKTERMIFFRSGYGFSENAGRFLFLFAWCLAFPAFSQTDLQKQNFQSRVKYVKEKTFSVMEDPQKVIIKMGQLSSIEYGFNETGDIIRWADFYQNQLVSWYYIVEFDSVRNQKIQSFRQNENFVSASTVFQYDNEGKELHWYHRDAGEITLFIWQNEYDKKGLKVRARCYSGDLATEIPDRYYVYKYDKLGRRVSEHWYSGNGVCTKIIRTHYYKKQESMIGVMHYDGNDNLTERWLLMYNQKNELIEKWHYKPGGYTDSHVIYQYDDFGNQTEVKNYNYYDSLISSRSFQYTYDLQNNWLTKLETFNDIPDKIVEREIFYFE